MVPIFSFFPWQVGHHSFNVKTEEIFKSGADELTKAELAGSLTKGQAYCCTVRGSLEALIQVLVYGCYVELFE